VGSFGSRGEDCILSGDVVDSIVSLADAMGQKDALEKMYKASQ
jgi:hypothetical protein